jgi:3-methyladenine DNA glycosylase AlkD
VAEIRSLGTEEGRAGMARFGINAERAFGVSMAQLRPLAKQLGRDQELSTDLWATGFHEARLLAVLIGEPAKVTRSQMDDWAAAFDSWDLCDQACMKLFVRTSFVDDRITVWAADEREFVRRAAFALMASKAVHHKKAPDEEFTGLLDLIEQHAGDERNYVRKAVNWALRQIGKRSLTLHQPALELAERLAARDDKSARWIGRDASRELTDPIQLERLRKRAAQNR